MSKKASAKKTGLGSYAPVIPSKPVAKKTATDTSPRKPKVVEPGKRSPKKIYDEPRTALTIRLTDAQYRRVKELGLDERASVQELALRGLSLLFEQRGLPKL